MENTSETVTEPTESGIFSVTCDFSIAETKDLESSFLSGRALEVDHLGTSKIRAKPVRFEDFCKLRTLH